MKLWRADWLQGLCSRKQTSARQRRRSSGRDRSAEALESRVVLAAHVWSNAAGTFLWSDPGNWIGGAPSPTEDNVEIYFPRNAHLDAEFGQGGLFTSITSVCDIDFQNPIAAIYAVGDITGAGYESLNAPSSYDLMVNVQISEGLALPIDTDGTGILVGDFAPEGVTQVLPNHLIDLQIRGALSIPAGDLQVYVDGGRAAVTIYGPCAEIDPTSTSRLVTSGTGRISLVGPTDFDQFIIQDSSFSAVFNEALGPAEQPALIRLSGQARYETVTEDPLPATKDFELIGDETGTPTLRTFVPIQGDITVTNRGLLSGGIRVEGKLQGDGLLQIDKHAEIEILGANTGFTGDVTVLGKLSLGNSESLGPHADQSIITLGRSSELHLNNSVSLSGPKQLRVGRQTTISATGMAAIFGPITASVSSNLKFVVDGADSQLSVTGNLTMPREVIVKEGKGTLRITGPSNHANGTQVRSGRVSIEHPDGIGTGPITLSTGTELLFFLHGDQEIGNAISVAPGVGQEALPPAQIIFADMGSASNVEISSPSGITLHDRLAFVVENSDSELLISAAISGESGFDKDGPGTLRLVGFEPNTFEGATRIQDGTLLVSNEIGDPELETENTRLFGGDIEIGDGEGDASSARLLVEGNLAYNAIGTGGNMTIRPDGEFHMTAGGNIDLASLDMTGGSFVSEPFPNGNLERSKINGTITVHPADEQSHFNAGLSIGDEGTEFAIDADASLLVSGIIKGPVSFDPEEVDDSRFLKSGEGRLILAGGSASATPFTIADGTVELDSEGSALLGDIEVTGGTLISKRDGQFGLGTVVTIRDGGELELAENVHEAVVVIDNELGQVTLGANSALATSGLRLALGIVELGENSTLTFTGDEPGIVAEGFGAIFGDGSIELTDADLAIAVVPADFDAILPDEEISLDDIEIDPALFELSLGVIAVPIHGPEAEGEEPAPGVFITGGGVLALVGESTYSGTTTIDNATLNILGAIANSHVEVGGNGTLGGIGAVGSARVSGDGGNVDPGLFVPIGFIAATIEEVLAPDGPLSELPDGIEIPEEILGELSGIIEVITPTLVEIGSNSVLTVIGDLEFAEPESTTDELGGNSLTIDLEPNFAPSEDTTPVFVDRLLVQGTLTLGSRTELHIGAAFHAPSPPFEVVLAGEIIGDFDDVVPHEPYRVGVFDTVVVLKARPVVELPETGGNFVLTASIIDEDSGAALIELRDESAAPDAEPIFSTIDLTTDDIFIVGSELDDRLRIVDPSEVLGFVEFDGAGGTNSVVLDEFDEFELFLDFHDVGGGFIDIEYINYEDSFDDFTTLDVTTRNVTFIDGSGSDPDFFTVLLTHADDEATITEFSADPSDTRFVINALGISVVADLEVAELNVDGHDGNDRIQAIAQARPDLEPIHLDGGEGNDTLIGHAGSDLLHGQEGNDVLLGMGGADEVLGGDGNDMVRGQGGADSVGGGDGDDVVDGGGSAFDILTEEVSGSFVLLNGSSTGLGNDRYIGVEFASLTGSDSDDHIDASAYLSSVTINGGSGNDTIIGTANADLLNGDSGNDILYGRAGNDVLQGSFGDDILMGEAGNDFLSGNDDNDTVNGQAGDDTISGGNGNDRLNGGTGVLDTLFELVSENATLIDGAMTGMGTDLLLGIEQAQLLGNGNDNIIDASGYSGKATLIGGDGSDRLVAGINGSRMSGGDGDDVLVGRAGNDVLLGGNGNDSLIGGAGNDLLLGEAGNDNLSGNSGSNTLSGGDGDDRINGRANEINETVTFSLQSVLTELLGLSRKLGS